MRLFIAVDIGDNTREQIRRVREALQARLQKARRAPRVTWVKDEAAHVTLRFIGEVPEATADQLRVALASPLDAVAFRVRWGSVGIFPGGRNPRVIWIGAAEGAAELQALAAMVNERVAPIVGPGESRPFRAHLTIGRVKDPGKGIDWAEALAAAPVKSTRGVIDHVTLYQSRLSPKGPTYTALVSSKFNVQSSK